MRASTLLTPATSNATTTHDRTRPLHTLPMTDPPTVEDAGAHRHGQFTNACTSATTSEAEPHTASAQTPSVSADHRAALPTPPSASGRSPSAPRHAHTPSPLPSPRR